MVFKEPAELVRWLEGVRHLSGKQTCCATIDREHAIFRKL